VSEYRRGQALLRRCRAILETAETEIRQLSLPELEAEASADGGPVSDAPRRGRRGETT
jgi:exonuclease VII small subunit